MKKILATILISFCMGVALSGLHAQTPAVAPTPAAPATDVESLLIGPGDGLHVQVIDAPEVEQHVRVTDAGFIPLVGAGNVQVAGLTPAQAASAIHDHLISAHYMNHPQVLVTVEQYATQTVSVVGQVGRPGAYPISTPRSVLDVLSFAGGLTNIADRNILIERQGNKENTVKYYVSNNAEQAVATQVMIHPGDTLIVPRAGIVYILGDVNRPGGFAMANNEEHMTLLEALSLAGGVTRAAKQGHARLIRKADPNMHEAELNLGEIQKGKQPNPVLYPGDILYVPFSFVKNLVTTGGPGIAASATSAVIYAAP